VISVANRRIGALADLNSVLAVFGMEIAASADQAAAWGQIRSITTRFLAADVLVLAVPLRNFSVPYKLNFVVHVQEISQQTGDQQCRHHLRAARKAERSQ
jgi:FMN-dependent NADH-azoreductase